MSDRPPHPDELVSAYLDGELTPAEAAAVQADETLAARAEELRAVRDAVAAPVSAPSAERRDQMIAAAIDAVSDVTVPSGVVVPLHRSVQPLLAAAAAVVAIAVVVGAGLLASRLGGGDDADMTASPGTTASDDPADFDMSESADGADAVAAPEPAAADEKPMADEESAYDDAMDEEPMAEEESAYDDAMDEKSRAEEESMADMQAAPEGLDMAAAQAEAAVAQAEAEAAAAASAAAADLAPSSTSTPADAPDAEADAAAGGGGGGGAKPTAQTVELPVVDLGALNEIDTLVNIVLARSEAPEPPAEPRVESGACAAAINEFATSIGAQATARFVAVLEEQEPVGLDAMAAVRDDGTTVVIYAVEPECEPSRNDPGQP